MICGYMWLSFVKDFCICYVCVFMSLDLCMWDYPALPAITLHKSPSLIPPYFPSFPFIHALFRVFAIVFASYFSSLLLMVVDHLLYLFLYSIHYLSFYGSYISIVFKNGSMVLQRTIYDPFLRAILIPKCTYFHL